MIDRAVVKTAAAGTRIRSGRAAAAGQSVSNIQHNIAYHASSCMHACIDAYLTLRFSFIQTQLLQAEHTHASSCMHTCMRYLSACVYLIRWNVIIGPTDRLLLEAQMITYRIPHTIAPSILVITKAHIHVFFHRREPCTCMRYAYRPLILNKTEVTPTYVGSISDAAPCMRVYM